MTVPTRELEVVEIKSGEIVHRIDITGRSESSIDRVIRGMLINMNRERYIVRDSDWSKENANG